MKLALIFDAAREDTIGIYFQRATRALGVHADHFWLRDAAAIPDGYDLYLRIDHGDYRHDVPDRLRPRAFYAIDTHLPHSWKAIRRAAPRYDVIYCCHRRGAEALGAAWVPVACDPEQHAPVDQPRRWDVAFVGTGGGVPRKFYLQALRERYPRSSIRHAPHTQLGAIYSAAASGFNFSIRDDVNMRAFEILCSGRLLLTSRLSTDDYDRLGLRESEQLVTYHGPRELFERIDYYLRHDDERERIAAAGRDVVLRSHTYAHRLQRMLQLAAERLRAPWQPPALPDPSAAPSPPRAA